MAAGFGAVLACGPAFAADAPDASLKSTPPTVVFTCKYGSVKSLIAAERFNRIAEQRGLSVRAIGRAANPEVVHPKVSDFVAKQLALEGYKVADFKPQAVTREEAAAAIRVVHISLQGEDDPLSAVAKATSSAPIEVWSDVLSMIKISDANGIPGTVDLTSGTYQRVRGVLISHVDALFEELAKKQDVAAAK